MSVLLTRTRVTTRSTRTNTYLTTQGPTPTSTSNRQSSISTSPSTWQTHDIWTLYHVCYTAEGNSVLMCIKLPSVLWHCWMGVTKSICPVKMWMMRCWCGHLSGLRCSANDMHMVQLMPLPPHRLLLHQNADWFNLSGACLHRLSWKRGH